MTQLEQSRSSLRPLALGCAFILLVCFAVYDVLLYSNLRRELSDQSLSTASVSASTLSMRLSAGLRLGKDLRRFAGMDRLLRQTMTDLPEGTGIAIMLPDGSLAASMGAERHGDGISRIEVPIQGRTEQEAGRAVISLPDERFSYEATQRLQDIVILQCILTLATVLLLLTLAAKKNLAAALYTIPRGKILAVCLSGMLLLMSVNVLQSMRVYLRQYELASSATAMRIGRILSEDLEKLLLVGVSLGQAGNLGQYLQKMSANVADSSIVLNLLDPTGHVIGSSHAPDTALAEDFSFRIPLTGGQASRLTERSGGRSWSVSVSMTREARIKGVLSLALNVGTLVVIALMVMLEAFLLFFHVFFARKKEDEAPEAAPASRDSSMLRVLLFIFVLAKDLSISFIPLRMGEFAGEGGMQLILMGLPVSAEIVAAACGIMLAGFWMKKRGLALPMTMGIILAMLGNLASLLAPWAWCFIAARGLAGAGYGLALLPAQAAAVKEGRLTFLFAGVYAGSLCGSALGAMLAEYLGYSLVFGVSALLMLGLTPLPIALFNTLKKPAHKSSLQDMAVDPDPGAPAQTPHAAPAPTASFRRALPALFSSPAFMALLFFSLLPASFLDIGMMNYFLPVYLHEAGVSQSDIGRIFMLYCLVLIYIGPRAEKIINARGAEHKAVFLGGLACALAVGGFLLLPPLTASLSGALLLGLAVCFNIPGQSGCLLRLPEAGRLGVELSMSVLNAVERAGQMVGPVCIGALFASVSLPLLAMGGSLGAGLASLAFILSFKVFHRTGRTQHA